MVWKTFILHFIALWCVEEFYLFACSRVFGIKKQELAMEDNTYVIYN